MVPENSIQPMELVISALHTMKNKKGSSVKKILKYLEKKYNASAGAFKTEVDTGLQKGVSFGLVEQKGGLFRLNGILRPPISNAAVAKPEKIQKIRVRKANAGLKKTKMRKLVKVGKNARALPSVKRKTQLNANPKKKTKPKKIMRGRNPKRQADIRRHKFRRQKSKTEKAQKGEKRRKI